MTELDLPEMISLRVGDSHPVCCDGVALWLAGLEHWPSEQAQAGLSPRERERGERFRLDRDRRRYVAAHVALRDRLARHLGCSPVELRFDTGPRGKPYLANPAWASWHFNLSHSVDVALIALCKDGEVGVDLEVMRSIEDAHDLAMTVFGPQEQAELLRADGSVRDRLFLQGWTRKEACLKALGEGFNLNARSFEVGLSGGVTQVQIQVGQRIERLCVRSFWGGDVGGGTVRWVGALARRLGPA